jgi:hypothetical protein
MRQKRRERAGTGVCARNEILLRRDAVMDGTSLLRRASCKFGISLLLLPESQPTTSRCFIIALALIFASAAVGLCCRGGKKTAQESNSSFGGFTC